MSQPNPPSVHHINFLVRDLEAATQRFSGVLGLEFSEVETLPERGVALRRARAGETWIVLVQPTAEDGVPGKMLETRGEGVMLISFGTDDLDAALARAEAGGARVLGVLRDGLDQWRVADLDPATLFGVPVQLTDSFGQDTAD